MLPTGEGGAQTRGPRQPPPQSVSGSQDGRVASFVCSLPAWGRRRWLLQGATDWGGGGGASSAAAWSSAPPTQLFVGQHFEQ